MPGCAGVIDVRGLHYRYPGSGARAALRGVSFALSPGVWAACMGANGSGKTTLLHCLNGLLKPASGRVEVDGFCSDDPPALVDVRSRVGMVFQNPDNQIVATTVEREIAFGLENLGVGNAEMRRKVEDALRRFSLAPYRSVSPNLLSGGERQRLALASVWVMDPRYLVLDEPTSLLDPAGKAACFSLIRGVMKTRRVGVLMVTQYPEEALECDRLIVMDQGRIVLDGKPREVFRRRALLKRLGLNVPVEAELGALFA
jgi:energy-coupling factor transport system ATP-binding protein